MPCFIHGVSLAACFIIKVSGRGGAVNESEIKLEGNHKTTHLSSEKTMALDFEGKVNFEDF